MAGAAMGVVMLMTSCADSEAPKEPPELNQGTALIETDDSSALLYVLVAETAEQRSRAFETTTALEDDHGIAFLYFEPTTEPFVMEGRLALSLAFFDHDGEIVEVTEGGPCGASAETCPSYDPGVAYSGVLAAGSGVLEHFGVADGASVEIVPGSE